MSSPALCLAVRNVLWETPGIGTTELACDLAIGGKPHPAAGQDFYAVHPWGWATGNGDYDLHEVLGVKVTVSKKLGMTPKDRTLTAAWATEGTGLDAMCRKVITAIHRNQDVRARANAIIGATDAIDGTPNGFETELWFMGADSEPIERDDEWFGARSEIATGAITGMSMTMIFGRADRVQTIAGMT